MALPSSPGRYPTDFNIEHLQSYDTPIGGKLLVAELEITEYDLLRLTDIDIKERLTNILAKGIMNSEHVVFTKSADPIKFSELVRARCYLAPSDQVRILRQVIVK